MSIKVHWTSRGDGAAALCLCPTISGAGGARREKFSGERRSAKGNATDEVCSQDHQTGLAGPFVTSQEPERDDRDHEHTRSGH